MKKIKKVDNYQDFINLAPTSNATDIDEYSEILDYSLENKDIRNIAIFGNYGAGKSSFLKTYFKNNSEHINITLGSYGNDKKKVDEGKIEEYHQTIEKSILQQLLYQTDQEKVPQSRFKRLTKYSKSDMFFETFIFVLIILIFMLVFIPNFFEGFFEPYNNISEVLNILNFKIKSIKFYTNYFFTSLLYLLMFTFVVFCFYKIREFIKDNFYISKLKYKDAEIEINGKSESIFNKYLDEIIYFFQCSDYNVVIFEDIDRFNGALSIIEKLKELNYLLNTSSKITRKISFIYAIKDDFFEETTERTKFFDKTIPIIPVSSLSNSNEIIWDKFKNIYGENENKMYYEIDKKFINNISVFVDDMRTINNIMADFVLFSDKFIDKDLDNCKLMSMIFYKNLYPQKYALMLKGEGTLPNIIQNKSEIVNKLTKKLKEDNEKLQKEINDLEKENLLNILELKQVLVMNLVSISNDKLSYLKLKFSNYECNISDFLKEDFDISKIKNTTMTFSNRDYSYSKEFNEEEIFESFGGKQTYIKRLDNLNDDKEVSIEQKQKEISLIEKNIKDIREMSIKELIDEYGTDFISDNLNDFEMFILKRGLISSDYYDYITLFKEGNLTIQDMQFVKNVKKDSKMENYSYHLDNLNEVVNRLDIFDYSSDSILNFDLFDYIFDIKNKVELDIKNKILLQFENITDEKLDFIDSYLEKSELGMNFVNSLLLKKNNIWEKCYLKNSKNRDYIDKWVKIFLSNSKFLVNTDNTFINYINLHDKFYKLFSSLGDKHKEMLIKQNIKFKNIDANCTKDFYEFIFKNNLYEINENMLKLLLENTIHSSECLSNKFLTILEDERLKIMKQNIYNNFDIYIDNVYNNSEKHNNDENVILNILNNEDIKDNIKSTIIIKEEAKIKDISKISTDYYECVLNNNLIDYNWKNVIYMYNYVKNIPEKLANIINNIDNIQFINLLDNQNDFLVDLISNKDINLNTLEKNINLFDCKILDLENIDFIYEFDKLKIIINNNILEFNFDNFNYIKNKSIDLLVLFINKNKKYYIGNCDDFDVKDIANELIENLVLDEDIKLTLFENEVIKNTMLKIDLLFKLVNDNKYGLRNEESNNLIFSSNLEKNKKYSYLNKIKEEIDTDIIKDYLCMINSEFEFIGVGKNNFSIGFDQSLYEILKKFELERIISSCIITRKNKIMIYNLKK